MSMETKRYTQREILVVDLSNTGMHYSEIAKRLRMTFEDVRRIDDNYQNSICGNENCTSSRQ